MISLNLDERLKLEVTDKAIKVSECANYQRGVLKKVEAGSENTYEWAIDQNRQHWDAIICLFWLRLKIQIILEISLCSALNLFKFKYFSRGIDVYIFLKVDFVLFSNNYSILIAKRCLLSKCLHFFKFKTNFCQYFSTNNSLIGLSDISNHLIHTKHSILSSFKTYKGRFGSICCSH